MSVAQNPLAEHLATGSTAVCRCWSVTRRDGRVFGFTDHDRALTFSGVTFRADTGMTARAIEQVSGLSVDNTEVIGALSHPSIREADIVSGRFDGAKIKAWLVNWRNVSERVLFFSGSIGEITRAGGAFQAELRGLSEALNQPRGRTYQASCTAVLGDKSCGVDLNRSRHRLEAELLSAEAGRILTVADPGGFDTGWFARGRLRVTSGEGTGLVGLVKADIERAGTRRLELWETLRAEILPGDTIRVEAGCDKRAGTCRQKFDNVINFRGFPNIPGEDWVMSYPRREGVNDGGSRS